MHNTLIDDEVPHRDILARVHYNSVQQTQRIPLGVLWTRKAIQNSPLAKHVSAVSKKLYAPKRSASKRQARNHPVFPPLNGLKLLSATRMGSEPFREWSRNLVEMTQNSLGILGEIIKTRTEHKGENAKTSVWPESPKRSVWPQRIAVGDDAAGAMLHQAASTGSRCTKSKVGPCYSPAYVDVMHEFGFAGVATNPVFLGTWWMSLMLQDYGDWRQDYVCMLGYTFYFEYNIDKLPSNKQSSVSIMKQVMALWDMPSLAEDLRLRRLHMLCSFDFFDLKRRHEAAFSEHRTDGATAWVHASRDTWRDFKALDSGGYAHWLSFAPGDAGRDDMMLSGLVNDWVDLGPDLRYQECNQAVFALTRASLKMDDLLECYERTVWMLNASSASPRRYIGFLTTMAASMWQLCNHRQDVWRYYALGHKVCLAAQSRQLYKVANLAECYDGHLKPRKLPDAKVLAIPRQDYYYSVWVEGREHTGVVKLHATLCEGVELGLIPKPMVDFQIIVPLLLRRQEIGADAFIKYMDGGYCSHFAHVVRSGHRSGFSRAYSRAIAALVMEQWWSGQFLAMGVGSLIDAQPDRIAQDRAH
ncbi:hypothetical protein CDD82_3155 [Ophiocordyceps australis]|uniref:Uncharacterized protein n=1 Tax=Ophiocordyceps australis TaxID=1399860 RepID=A0A2C5ZEE2_9HYPO|nr:hypothetical protein CDD82_3155 [Ophiocordyceps australis]